jgi:RNA recognition motif-containing protein
LKKIYVGNLPWSTGDADLKDLFSRFGKVHSAAVIMDRETGRSRGFGFVEMATSEEAGQAVTQLNGRELDGRQLKVEISKPRTGGSSSGARRGGSRW